MQPPIPPSAPDIQPHHSKAALVRFRLAQALIGAVLVMNVQSAVAFLLNPGVYAPAFELSGVPGEAAIRGFGVLFLMWSVPYAVAFWNPRLHRTALLIAICMQATGLVGELQILFSIPSEYASLRVSIGHFAIFDAAGLVALLAAGIIILIQKKSGSQAVF